MQPMVIVKLIILVTCPKQVPKITYKSTKYMKQYEVIALSINTKVLMSELLALGCMQDTCLIDLQINELKKILKIYFLQCNHFFKSTTKYV